MFRRRSVSPDILEAGPAGLESQKQKIDDHIAEVHRLLPARRRAHPAWEPALASHLQRGHAGLISYRFLGKVEPDSANCADIRVLFLQFMVV
jgi:hypothetical protein